MNINIKNYLNAIAVLAFLFSLFLVNSWVSAANVYASCYDKDSKSSQKTCIADQIKKECPKLKDSCVKDQLKKVETARGSAISSCLQNNKNQPDKESVCEEKFTTLAAVKNNLNSNGDATSDTPIDSSEQLSAEEQKVKDYNCDGKTTQECIDTNPIIEWLNWGINLVAGVVGVGAVLMIIWAGIQYTTARDNAQAVAAAKQKIINVVIGIAAFIFLYAFLNWLVPGGVFK